MNKLIDWLEAIWTAELPSNSKYVASYLRTYMNAKRDLCWPSIGRISRETGLSEQTVRKHLKCLEDSGWLAIERSEGGHSGTTNRYQAVIPSEIAPLQRLDPTPATIAPLPLQQLEGNKQSNKQKNNQVIIGNELLTDDIPDSNREIALKYWQKKGINLDVEEQWILFVSHHKSKPNKKIKDYYAAWRTWYVNAVKFNKKQQDGKEDVFMRLVDNSWAEDLL